MDSLKLWKKTIFRFGRDINLLHSYNKLLSNYYYSKKKEHILNFYFFYNKNMTLKLVKWYGISQKPSLKNNLLDLDEGLEPFF